MGRTGRLFRRPRTPLRWMTKRKNLRHLREVVEIIWAAGLRDEQARIWWPARPEDSPSETRASFRMMLEQKMTRPVPILMFCGSREDEGLILEFLNRKLFQVSFFVQLLDGHHRGRLWCGVNLDRMRP